MKEALDLTTIFLRFMFALKENKKLLLFERDSIHRIANTKAKQQQIEILQKNSVQLPTIL